MNAHDRVSAADDEAKTWRPDKGDTNPLVGALADVRTGETQYGTYPVVELNADDGQVWIFHSFHDVAKKELANLSPDVGDRIEIHWLGVPEGKSYHKYRVRNANHVKTIDWSRVGGTKTEPSALRDDVDDVPFDLPG